MSQENNENKIEITSKDVNLISAGFSGSGLGHGNGANLAPMKIIEKLKDKFTNESGNEPKFKTIDLNKKLDEHNVIDSHLEIEKCVSSIESNNFCILIGGDHSVTYPSVNGFVKNQFIKNKLIKNKNINDKKNNYNKDFLFIVFDAHPDLIDDFKPPTQEDYLKVLIEEDIVKPENVIIVGVRNWDKIEINYLNEKNIIYFDMKTIFNKSVKKITNEIIDIINKKELDIYLSLDIDVVDPVEAIGTGYTEHGGLSSRELIYMIQEIVATKKLLMADIVEVNPSKDINDMTSELAAKLIMELI